MTILLLKHVHIGYPCNPLLNLETIAEAAGGKNVTVEGRVEYCGMLSSGHEISAAFLTAPQQL